MLDETLSEVPRQAAADGHVPNRDSPATESASRASATTLRLRRMRIRTPPPAFAATTGPLSRSREY